MSFKKFREISHKTGLMSAFVAFVAISVGAMSATPVHAVQYRFGDVDVQIDNIVSFGLSMRTASRELALLPARNGGTRKDLTPGVDLIRLGGYAATFATEATAVGTAQTALAAAQKALADNTDDGQAATLAAAVTTAEGALATAQAALVAKQGSDASLAALALALDCGTATDLSDHAKTVGVGVAGSHCTYGQSDVSGAGLSELYNYDGSINTDDGRLNFDKDDLIGGTFKVTTELEAQTGDFTFFARFNAFYDAVLADDSNFARSEPLKNANRAQVYDIDMLDFYVDWSSEVANLPFTLRAGRQVINWGEATFILGGNSVFNPISVPAFRRPGSEIKEALLPVMAIYGSLSLPYDLTVEAYVGGWDSYDIDPGGGPFANSDSFEVGSGEGGNGARTYVGSGAYSGDNRRNCDAASSGNDVTALYGTAFDNVYGTCDTEDYTPHFLHNAASGGPNALGFVEQSRQRYTNTVVAGRDEAGVILGDTGFLVRADDNDPSDDGNYGISLRWYAENLNSTEFAVYYQNYTSRIPYAATIAYQPVVGPNVTNPNASSVTRGATAAGCGGTYAASGNFINNADTLGIYAKDITGVGKELERLLTFNDEGEASGIVGTDVVVNGEVTGRTYTVTANSKADEFLDAAFANATAAGVVHLTDPDSDPATAAVPVAITKNNLRDLLGAALDLPKDADGNSSLAASAIVGCMATYAQATAGLLLPTGASSIVTRYQIGLTAQYPEDIEVYGLSFNTTAFGWGVQGEIAYRDSMPLQVDTDALSIQAIAASCAWENFNAAAAQYYALQTLESTCGDFNKVFDGFVREKVYNIDIGTTATFTRSNPVVSALGADLGVFLTELGYVNVPNAEDYTVPNAQAVPAFGASSRVKRLSNLCSSGTDLPLGGVFALDPRGPLANNAQDHTKPTEMCRPTEESSGIVLFGYLQYNNVFGSAIGLRPTFAYQRGIDGRSPSPAGSFIEDNESLSLSVTAEYQAKWTASLGYTMYDGDVLYNRNVDRDYLSASVSYAF